MNSYHYQHQTKWILGGVWGIALVVLIFFSSSHQASAAAPAQQAVCQNFDITYLLDLSGSMGWGLGGSGGTRLEAAQDAIIEMNNVLAASGEGVRASLLTWTTGSGNIQVNVDMTNDFDAINAEVNTLTSGGYTPTAASFQATRNHLLNHTDPERQQIVLFITDGVPTEDLVGYRYDHHYVEDVEVMISEGVFRTPAQVRLSGHYYSWMNRYAGQPLADAMVEIDATVNQVENLVMHSIAILGNNFKQDILKYASWRSGGDYYPATTASELAASIQQAVYEGDCSSSLNLDVGHLATFYLGGTAQLMDPNVGVTGENEDVSTATIQITDHFDATNDRLFVGSTPSDSGTINGLSWWYTASTGTLMIVGVGTPAEYQDAMRQIRYTNSALDPDDTDMNNRTLDVSITSALNNVDDNPNLSGQTFVELIHIEGTEYGDAPASYGTAGQQASILLRLGDSVDTEDVALTSGDASGDDSDNLDDEDGISVAGGPLVRGTSRDASFSVTNNLDQTAYIQAWIDFDQNGFFDTSDNIIDGYIIDPNSGSETIDFSFSIRSGAVCGPTFARIRLTTELGTATGLLDEAFGEVEDYPLVISCDPPVPGSDFDHGDAPSTYGAAMAAVQPNFYLGAQVDDEGVALHSVLANGDDNSGVDDEDGASFDSTGILGATIPVTIQATNINFVNSYVNGWVDWNQDGVFSSGEQFINDYSVPLGSFNELIVTDFTVPINAACNDTYVRIRLTDTASINASENANEFGGGETEDYLFDVNCDADLSIDLDTHRLSDPALVTNTIQLEDSIVISAVAENIGPNYAPNVTATVSLIPGLDIQSIVVDPDWTCTLDATSTQMDCFYNTPAYPGFPAGTVSTIFTITGRVPGIFQPMLINGAGEITSSFPDPDSSNDTDTYAMDVEKVWEGDGIPFDEMAYFTHAIYDDSLPISSGNHRFDFEAKDLIQNPFQVPLQLIPGFQLDNPPELTAEFCLTHSTPGCLTSDAIMTGTVRLDGYTITEMVIQEVNGSGEPVDPTSWTNMLTTPISITYGVGGNNGRYAEIDQTRCDLWRFNYSSSVGACEASYGEFSSFSDSSFYDWSQNEYIEVILTSPDGRAVDCSSGLNADACINMEARPGVYRLTGEIEARLIFDDSFDGTVSPVGPGYNRIPEQVWTFTYPINIYVRVVSTFVEPD